jgi:hypothetical protein
VIATAQPLKQKFAQQEYRAAEHQAVLAYFECSHIVPSNWIAILESQAAELRHNAFEAIRHGATTTSPNLRLTDDVEHFIPTRRVTETGESFRGRHGKIVIIRK